MSTLTGKASAAPGPACWAVGDLQGCCDALEHLLAHPDLQPDDQLWFAGDLVNRGPRSLDTLRQVQALGARATSVLGNHDIHLLAVAAGVRRRGRHDTLDDILAAPDADALIDWLRQQPLMHADHGHLMVHAGLLPSWTPAEALALAREVEDGLRSPGWRDFLTELFGNQPAAWDDSLQGADRWRVIINACTRLRYCSSTGVMDFDTKEGVGNAPAGMMPWFDVPGRRSADTTVVFGHWSTLGWVTRPDLLSLDTGCVWGGQLTAVRLHDRHRIQIDCASLPGVLVPGSA